MTKNKIWTEPNTELLKKLWAEGRTAQEISYRIEGSTRSGILGKIHRMKLPVRAESPNPMHIEHKRMAGGATHYKKVKKVSKVKRKDREGISITSYANTEPKTMLDLKRRECQWPVRSEGKQHWFCAAEVAGKYPYCEKHISIAYQKGSLVNVKRG